MFFGNSSFSLAVTTTMQAIKLRCLPFFRARSARWPAAERRELRKKKGTTECELSDPARKSDMILFLFRSRSIQCVQLSSVKDLGGVVAENLVITIIPGKKDDRQTFHDNRR